MKIRFVLLPVLLLSMITLMAQGGERPTYSVFKSAESLKIDGVLNELAWSAAPEIGEFKDNSSGEPAPVRTLAKVLWDVDFLYFAFRSWDENITATLDQRDDHLWTEEVVEVFIKPDENHPNYLEFEVNPLGAMIDIYLIDIRKAIPYKSYNAAGLEWAIQVDGTVDGEPGDKSWTCEMAIPIAEFVTAANLPPKAGDRWKANLYRVDQLPRRAGWAWSPTLKADFHVPAMFGELVFSEKTVR